MGPLPSCKPGDEGASRTDAHCPNAACSLLGTSLVSCLAAGAGEKEMCVARTWDPSGNRRPISLAKFSFASPGQTQSLRTLVAGGRGEGGMVGRAPPSSRGGQGSPASCPGGLLKEGGGGEDFSISPPPPRPLRSSALCLWFGHRSACVHREWSESRN